MQIDHAFVLQVIEISRIAGKAILDIYDAVEKPQIEFKHDGSPVTAADFAAHHVIVQALEKLLPIPILSEEANLPDFSERTTWQSYWLIDPLDGTKEFIRRNGEFSVNIALIKQGIPVFGVVHIPVLDETYIGIDKCIAAQGNATAEKYSGDKKIADLQTRNLASRFIAKQTLDILISHRPNSIETDILMQNIAQHWPASLQYIKAGSSLKFCWLAEGRADFYPRLAPTSEWDTAAGQVVLVAAGGMVVNANDFMPLIYNSSASLINPHFFAMADSAANWHTLVNYSKT